MAAAKIRISKKFTFDMAHALYGHKGLCQNIHGHTYTLCVTLIGTPVNAPGSPDDGMLLDFSLLKTIVHGRVISVYDHALVLNGNSPHRQLQEIPENFEKVIYLEEQPTCENLVLRIADDLKQHLPGEVSLHHLSLQETPTATAEWFSEDN